MCPDVHGLCCLTDPDVHGLGGGAMCSCTDLRMVYPFSELLEFAEGKKPKDRSLYRSKRKKTCFYRKVNTWYALFNIT